MLAIHTILVPTDLSECSERAYCVALDMARDYHARLLVLCVDTPPRFAGHDSGLVNQVRQAHPADRAVPTRYCVVDGDPVMEILRAAREASCDLVVMGTHGRTGLERLFLGSVASQVASRVGCPVLLIPPASKLAAETADLANAASGI